METIQQTDIARPKKLYPYQETDLQAIFNKLEQSPQNYRLLYQLPTGGGKTVIFSEITKRFIERYGKKVAVLTHRTELCRQTSNTLTKFGVSNKIINSAVGKIRNDNDFKCYVAMVETLKNRLKANKIHTDNVGLIIIDEAHHNSFRKLLGSFKNAYIIGVTATPFSSDMNLPMYKTYQELIVGEKIDSLIEQGFLAKPKTIAYDIELNSLQTGISGDYTVKTSDELYSSQAMLDLLLTAYESHSKNKKTLIFNNGIFTSKRVYDIFENAGYPIRHLDNKTPQADRKEILNWFKKTKGAILTSVSILTTGFDEPTVQTVILNRATTSLTLYYQMIGRGSRKLPSKKTFNIIDLGNNTDRFGEWSKPIDWQYVFEKPEEFYDKLNYTTGSESSQSHQITPGLRSKFPNSIEIAFDIEEEFKKAADEGRKSKTVLQQSIRQHALMCIENGETISEALSLTLELDPEINWRLKLYAKFHRNTTKNYRDWLGSDYRDRLSTLIKKIYNKTKAA